MTKLRGTGVGGDAGFEVELPKDSALVGQTLYVVAAADLDGDGRYDVYTSPLIRVLSTAAP